MTRNENPALGQARRAARWPVAASVVVLLASCQLPGLLQANNATPVPSISPAGGDYTADQGVTIADSMSGATIYYTTDGSTPTTASARYTGPIPVSGSGTRLTIKAIALGPGKAPSPVTVASYIIGYAGSTTGQTAAPSFSLPAGSYSSDQSVTITDATSGAVVYVTTNGATPTTSSPTYRRPIAVAGNGSTVTIEAVAVAAGKAASAVVTARYTIDYGQVSSPQISPTGGSYSANQSVTISDATAGATIHYTLTSGATGVVPTTSSPVYGGSIGVAGNGSVETIEAMATKAGLTDSTTTAETITINYAQASTPQIGPASGTYSTSQSVYLSGSTTGATIYYTIAAGASGTTPTTSSSVYSGPISVTGDGTTETIEAMAVASGMANSTVASVTISILSPTPAPTFSPLGGTFAADQRSILLSDTAAATIYYTTDGSTPTTASTVYTGPLSVSGDGTHETIKAIAVAGSRPASSVAAQSYSIIYPAATPILSEGGGLYSTDQTVTITDTTAGATIYYTTNGTTPSPANYSGYSAPTSPTATASAAVSVAGSGTSEVLEAVAGGSRPASAVAGGGTYSILYAPTGLSAGTGTVSALPISWSSVGGAASYLLLRSTSSSFTGATTVYSGSTPTFTDGGLAAGTIYYYEVEAVDAAGSSAPSAPATVATTSALAGGVTTPTIPTGVSQTPPTALNSTLNSSVPSSLQPDYFLPPVSNGLEFGGYFYVFFATDYQNTDSLGISVYTTSGVLQASYLVQNIGRYATSVSISGGNVVFGPPYSPPASNTQNFNPAYNGKPYYGIYWIPLSTLLSTYPP